MASTDGELAEVIRLEDRRRRKVIDWDRWARSGGLIATRPDTDDST